MKTLIIAEKPSVAVDIAAALGGFARAPGGAFERADALVSHAIGHLVELDVPQAAKAGFGLDALPIVPAQFGLAVIAKTARQFDVLAKLMARADVATLVNACDAGREGELIFRYLVAKAGTNKPIARMWLQSMTPEAIRQAYQDRRPGAQYEALYHAAQCRSEADWIVGINASRAVRALRESQTGHRESMSAGRVQTPTLALLVHRELEIRNFVSKPYWEVHGRFLTRAGTYEARWMREQGEGDAHRIDDKKRAQAIVDRCSGNDPDRVEDQSATVLRQPPRLFDLTSLQREANQRFNVSAKATLDLAQSLYEKHKLLTYPRTDASVLPEDYLPTVRTTLASLVQAGWGEAQTVLDQGWVKPDKRLFDNAKISDHFAIVPTGQRAVGLSAAEAQVYELVVRRFLAAFYPPARYLQTVRITELAGERFRSSGRVLVEPGWLALTGQSVEEGAEPPLCALDPQEAVRTESITLKALKTKAPPRYTEASLLSAMERAGSFVEEDALREALAERGLGTPATRAAIIERILSPELGYAGRAGKGGKQLVPSDKGIGLIGFLEDNGIGDLASPKMTGEWERRLREMERSRYERTRFMDEIGVFTRQVVAAVRARAGSAQAPATAKSLPAACPQCGAALAVRPKSYSCQGCGFTLWKQIAGRALSEQEASALLSGKLGVLSGFRSRAGKPFSAALALKQDGKVEFVFAEREAAAPAAPGDAIGTCPQCGASVREHARWYACERGDFKLWKHVAKRPLTRAEATTLLREGAHPHLEGFTSSNTGKRFGAGLRLASGGRVEFVFDAAIR